MQITNPAANSALQFIPDDSVPVAESKTESETSNTDIYQHVSALIEKDELNEAESITSSFIADVPDSALMLGLAALVHYKRGRYGLSLELVERSLVSNPVNQDVLRLKGEIMHSLGYFDAAIEAVTIAVALFPDDSLLHQDLARYRFKLASSQDGLDQHTTYSLAANDLRSALRIAGPEVGLLCMLAFLEIATGNYSDAEAVLSNAVAEDPESPAANYLMGKLAFEDGDYASAEVFLIQAVSQPSPYFEQASEILNDVRKKLVKKSKGTKDALEIATTAGVFVLACLASILPTMLFWLALDIFTGYFPPLWVAFLSVPIAPGLMYVYFSLTQNSDDDQGQIPGTYEDIDRDSIMDDLFSVPDSITSSEMNGRSDLTTTGTFNKVVQNTGSHERFANNVLQTLN